MGRFSFLRSDKGEQKMYSNLRALLGVWLVLHAAIAWGQVTTGTFYGIVSDPSGAVVAGAKVTLAHEGTGAVSTATTDPTGEFVFNFLPVGLYTLRIEASGFKLLESRGMEVLAAQSIRKTFNLDVGQVSETVSVSGQATQVNTVAAEQRE